MGFLTLRLSEDGGNRLGGLGLPYKTCSSAQRAVPRGDREPCRECQGLGVMARMKMNERSGIRELIWNWGVS